VPVVTRNFTPIVPTDRRLIGMEGLTYTFYYPQLSVDGDPNTSATIAIDASINNFAPTDGLYLPVAFKFNGPPTWFYKIEVTVSSLGFPTGVNGFVFFEVTGAISSENYVFIFINQPVIQQRTGWLLYSPPLFRGYYVSNEKAVGYRDHSTSLYSPEFLNRVYISTTKKTITFDLTVPVSNINGSTSETPTTTVIDSAFNGLLMPRISQLQGTSELYIILHFLVINQGSSSQSLSQGALFRIWDFTATIPSPDGEVYVWDETIGLSGPQTGSSSKVFDGSLTTYETVYPSSPRRGILVVYPTKKTIPRLKVYGYSSSGQTLRFYNGVDTLPPTGSPSAQVSIGTTLNWYTVLNNQTEIRWSYLLV